MKFQLRFIIITKKDYHSKDVLNLYKKYLVTLVFHVQQFRVGMLNSIGQEITFEDVPHADRARSALTPESIEAVRHLINVGPHIAYQQIQDILQLGSAATKSIPHDYLGSRKMTCRWMSQFLTEAVKEDCVDFCLAMLKKFDGGRSKRVDDIITDDKS